MKHLLEKMMSLLSLFREHPRAGLRTKLSYLLSCCWHWLLRRKVAFPHLLVSSMMVE